MAGLGALITITSPTHFQSVYGTSVMVSWSMEPTTQFSFEEINRVQITVDNDTPTYSNYLKGGIKVTDLAPGLHAIVLTPLSRNGLLYDSSYVAFTMSPTISGKGMMAISLWV